MSTWDITITDANGTTYTPHIYAPPGQDYPTEVPAANGTPTLRFGVLQLSGSDSWFDSKFENADISVSKGGTTQPYSTLRGATDTSAEGIVILEAEGGEQLDRRVDESFGVVETHTAAEQVVTNATSYGVDIPTPATTTTTAATVRDRTGGLTSADLSPQKQTSPAHVNGSGELTLYQTLHFDSAGTTLSTIGDQVSFQFSNDYAIPAGELGVALNADADLFASVAVEASVDGTVIGRYSIGAFVSTTTSTEPQWEQKVAPNVRLPPGTHTCRFEVVEVTRDGVSLSDLPTNGACVFDNRFSYTFDPDLVNGPELYPSTTDGTTVSLPPAIPAQAVTGVDFSGTYQDAEPVEVTVGTNGQTQTGFGDQSADFSDRGAAAEVEIGFKAYGTDSTKTPESGFKVTTLQSFDLSADLETMPLVVDERFQGTVSEVLTELADTLRGDFVWTFDTDSTGTKIVRFVRSGARSTTENDIERYTIEKNTGTTLEEVKVVGGPVEVTGEQVRVQHGTAVDLQRDNLVEGSETVEQDGTVFERGREYSIDYENGTITADSNPARTDPIPDDSLVSVSYAFQPSAVRTASGVSTPERTAVIDELPLRSDAACGLAAEQILDAAQSPQYVAEARIRGDTTFSAVEELVAGRLPVSNLELVDITATPGGARARLEAQQSPSGVIDDVTNRITSVARHVR